MEIPLLVKLMLSLCVIITLNKITGKLFISMLGGALLFGFWSGQGVQEAAAIIAAKAVSLDTLSLLLIVSMVIILSDQMSKSGMIGSMVEGVRAKITTRTSLALLPAIIGLLPMPGGALFSAPLLDTFDGTEGINQQAKTSINYWFRHIWEYGWPLYPGVILAASISGIDLMVFMAAALPPIALSITVGYIFLLRRIPKHHHAKISGHRMDLRPFIPIVVVILLYSMVQLLFPSLVSAFRYAPMLIGLAGALITLQLLTRLNLQTWVLSLTSKKLFQSLLIILMVYVYGAFIEADLHGTPISQLMTQEMAEMGIPALPLIMLIPFVAGLTMGVSVGFVGASMPVVVALIGVDPTFGSLLGHTMLAFISGFMGTMLSPLHVCLIVTCNYYHTNLHRTLATIVPLAAVIAVAGFFYSRVLIMLF